MPENKKKRKAGRPSKRTKNRADLLIRALEMCMPINMACYSAGIDASTFWKWIKADPDFAMKINFSRAAAVSGLIQTVLRTDPTGAWKILKSIDRKNFGENAMGQLEEGSRELHDYDGEDIKLLEAAAIDE